MHPQKITPAARFACAVRAYREARARADARPDLPELAEAQEGALALVHDLTARR